MYFNHLKQGVKPDAWSELCKAPVQSFSLFPDAVLGKAGEISNTNPRVVLPSLDQALFWVGGCSVKRNLTVISYTRKKADVFTL